MRNWRYFDPERYDFHLRGVDPLHISMSDVARHIAGVPLIAVSGKRTPEENIVAGGSPTSSHLKGVAVDYRCTDPFMMFKMIDGFQRAGFTRIGLNFEMVNGRLEIRGIHVDIDTAKVQGIIWSKVYAYR